MTSSSSILLNAFNAAIPRIQFKTSLTLPTKDILNRINRVVIAREDYLQGKISVEFENRPRHFKHATDWGGNIFAFENKIIVALNTNRNNVTVHDTFNWREPMNEFFLEC